MSARTAGSSSSPFDAYGVSLCDAGCAGDTVGRMPDATAGFGRALLRHAFSATRGWMCMTAAGRTGCRGQCRANSVQTIGYRSHALYLVFASACNLEINNLAIAIGPKFMAGDVRASRRADGVFAPRFPASGWRPSGAGAPGPATPGASNSGVAVPGSPTRTRIPRLIGERS